MNEQCHMQSLRGARLSMSKATQHVKCLVFYQIRNIRVKINFKIVGYNQEQMS